MSKQPPSARFASALGPCLLQSKLVGRDPALEVCPEPSHHSTTLRRNTMQIVQSLVMASDRGLHYLSVSILWVVRNELVKVEIIVYE